MADAHAFRNDIQGLRSLAVLPVVLYHAFPQVMTGGFVGVDIFFVISGYLISRIIHQEIGEGRFSIASFYARRVRRIFPALFLMLLAVMLAGLVLLPPGKLMELAVTAIGTIGFGSNVVFYNMSGYFAGSSVLKPLLHTWSLAVEEQFYLVFPFGLMALARFAPRWTGAALYIAAILSLALCVVWMRYDSSGAFYLPLTRAYELLIGAIVALRAVPDIRRPAALEGLAWLGIAMMLGAIFFFSEAMAFPGLAALVPCVGAALVIYAGERGTTSAARMLSLPPLVFVGSLSYSLYLWHWPILVFGRFQVLRELNAAEGAAAVLLAVALAYASWRWVERPVLRVRAPRQKILVAGGAMMLVGAVAAALPLAFAGLPGRFDAASLALLRSAEDTSAYRATCHSNEARLIPPERACIFGDTVRADIVMWGDSFGAELVVALGETLKRSGRGVRQMTDSACPPALRWQRASRPRCASDNDRILRYLVADPGVREVVLVANYLQNQQATPQTQQPILAGIARSARVLHAAGKQVTLIYPIPRMPFTAPIALGLLHERGSPEPFGQPNAEFRSQSAPAVAMLDGLVQEIGARRIIPADALCDDVLCHATAPRAGSFYFDGEHLSLAGARYVIDHQWKSPAER